MPGRVTVRDLASGLENNEVIHIVDVRDPWERAIAKLEDHQHIPLGELPERFGEIRPPDGALVVVYCHHGVRSLAAAEFLKQRGLEGVVSLDGGIDAWAHHVDPKTPIY